MKNSLLILLVFIAKFSLLSLTMPIDSNKNYAINFLAKRNIHIEGSSLEVFEIISKLDTNGTALPCFVTYNLIPKGFITMSLDKRFQPVLAYSLEDNSDSSKYMPDNLKFWFDNMRDEIYDISKKNQNLDLQNQKKWQELERKNNILSPRSGYVLPLLTTKWSQSPYYNMDCPYDNSQSKYCVTGCVATAMAQIMKYWNHPITGKSSSGYSSNYGWLSANYGTTNYDWNSMPDQISSYDSDIAQLMSHCGISVNMDYSPNSSGAYTLNQGSVSVTAENAFKNYFKYQNSAYSVFRSNYSISSWISILKNELVQSQPILFKGQNSNGGHAFILDGYDVDDYFHINWGWNGSYNGYYYISSLSPTGSGTGGSSGGYNQNQGALIGLVPIYEPKPKLYVNSIISTTPSRIYEKKTFDISVSLTNNSSINFTGDLAFIMYDMNYNSIGNTFILNNQSITANEAKSITFNYVDTLDLISGQYFVKCVYKHNSDPWKFCLDTNSFLNYKEVTIFTNTSTSLSLTNFNYYNSPVEKMKDCGIKANVKNTGNIDFKGEIKAELYNSSKTLVIGKYTEITGLKSDSTYSSDLIFKNIIQLPAGNYNFKLSYRIKDSSNWIILYEDPSITELIDPLYNPDEYEYNNIIDSSKNIPIIFNSVGAENFKQTDIFPNIHFTKDVDYFNINLTKDSSYWVELRTLDRKWNPGNLPFRNSDAEFAYSIDNGQSWTDFQDDTTLKMFRHEGGRLDIQCRGQNEELGGYQLTVLVIRMPKISNSISGYSTIEKTMFYPNPFKEKIEIKIKSKIEIIKIFDIMGKMVHSEIGKGNEQIINLSNLDEGVYFIEVISKNGESYKQKIIKSKN